MHSVVFLGCKDSDHLSLSQGKWSQYDSWSHCSIWSLLPPAHPTISPAPLALSSACSTPSVQVPIQKRPPMTKTTKAPCDSHYLLPQPPPPIHFHRKLPEGASKVPSWTS